MMTHALLSAKVDRLTRRERERERERESIFVSLCVSERVCAYVRREIVYILS